MPERFPIVFLPGIMGSRLYFTNSDQYWDPDSSWRMLFWAPLWPFRDDDDNRRQLHASEPAGVVIDPLDSNVVDSEGVAHGWGGVVWSFYGSYLQNLRTLALDNRVFAVGYDWRQDIQWLGEYAADRLSGCLDLTGAAKLNVVTHSMGGLVLRAACLHEPALVPRLGKVLFVCPPTVGAVLLYRRLFTGLVGGLDGGNSIADRAFRFLLGRNRTAFVGNMSGLPGAMQLLPSEHYPVVAGTHWHSELAGGTPHTNLYPNVNCPPGLFDHTLNLPVAAQQDFQDRVLDVGEFHVFLGSPTRTDVTLPERWLVYGTGRDTETEVRFNGSQLQQPQPTPAGDGTVPEVSAQALNLAGNRVFRVNDLEHSMACTHPEVWDFTQQVFP